MTTLPKSLEDRIKELAYQSGYFLENEVCTELHNNNFMTYPQDSFIDEDTGKERKLDIYANYIEHTKDTFGASITLLIECKKIPGNLWVFRRLPESWGTFTVLPIKYNTTMTDLGEKDEIFNYESIKNMNLHFSNSNYYYNDYQEYILDDEKSNNRKDNLFSAIIKIIKALYFHCEFLYEIRSESIESLICEPLYYEYLKKGSVFNMILPLIVFDGYMYELLVKQDEPVVNQIQYAQLFTRITNRKYTGSYLIEIITSDYVNEYIQNLKNDLTIIKSAQKNMSYDYKKRLCNSIYNKYKDKLTSIKSEI